MSPVMGIGFGFVGILASFFLLMIASDLDFFIGELLFSVTGILSIIFLIMSIITDLIVPSVKTEPFDQRIATTLIISVPNSISTEGEGSSTLNSNSFVIAAGEVYRYYYETPEGIRQSKVPADETVIKYTDETPALLKITDTTKTTEYWWWFYRSEYDTSSTHYELSIPEGSVVNQFNLNQLSSQD